MSMNILIIMENHEKFDPDEIQICKPFSVVNDRIDNFLKRRREDNDDRNTRVYAIKKPGSSRTCSTVENKRKKTSECFVKTTKVQNDIKPHDNGMDLVNENNCTYNHNSVGLKLDVYERISNLETCLNIQNNNDDMTIYEKLKSIEDHVLQLQNMVINNGGNSSNIYSNDQHGIVNLNLKSNDNSIQEKTHIIKNNSKNELKTSTSSDILPKKSKYTAEEIQKLINNINKIESERQLP